MSTLKTELKPVAWMWLEGAELLNGTEVEQFERIEISLDKPEGDVYGLTPLYSSAPPPQQQDAELGKELDRFICEFCDNLQNDGADGEDRPMTDDQRKFARGVIDGLLGDPEWDDLWGRVIESRVSQRLQQQDNCVGVPVEPTYAMLCALSGEWHPHKFGNARERYAALLAAAKEPR